MPGRHLHQTGLPDGFLVSIFGPPTAHVLGSGTVVTMSKLHYHGALPPADTSDRNSVQTPFASVPSKLDSIAVCPANCRHHLLRLPNLVLGVEVFIAFIAVDCLPNREHRAGKIPLSDWSGSRR